jgi:hypothetical protein
MRCSFHPRTLCAALAIAAALPNLRARAHDHLEAGVLSTAPGAPLAFLNAADFGGAAGFVFDLGSGDAGTPYDGYYFMDDLVFVAQAATPDYGGPEPDAAGLGTHVVVELLGISGPAHASFAFWETAEDGVDSTNLTWSLPVPLAAGTNRIDVTQAPPGPGADPYGHLHGRIYSVTAPGLYKTTWRFIDTSTNGPGGGPVQAPSAPFDLYFQAGLTVGDITTTTTNIVVTFAAPSNIPDSGVGPATQYILESSASLEAGSTWSQAADIVDGDDHLHLVAAPSAGPAGYFRLRTP